MPYEEEGDAFSIVCDGVLAHILFLVKPTLLYETPTHCRRSLMLVCRRFRNVLLAHATSMVLNLETPTVLHHCRNLRALEVREMCKSLPWEVGHVVDRGAILLTNTLPCLTSITRVRFVTGESQLEFPTHELKKLHVLPALRVVELFEVRRAIHPLLAELPKTLSALTITGSCVIDRSALDLIAKLTGLQLLDMRTRSNCTHEVSCLTPLSQIESLSVRGLSKTAGLFSASEDACEHLDALTTLTSLSIMSCKSSMWTGVEISSVEVTDPG